jgi:anaerobic selenocysteine-containing dehydrogenase
MDNDRKDTGKWTLSRRDFLKASAAGAAGVGLAEFAQVGPAAAAVTGAAGTFHTTCPYCSASCGQLVAVDAVDATKGNQGSGNVIDVYGDYRSPMNGGGLCAKGAGALQLATNPRRLGAWTAAEMLAKTGSSNHPVKNLKAPYNPANVFLADGTSNPVAYKRIGNEDWTAMALDDAWDEILLGDGVQTGLLAYRGDETYLASHDYNSKQVAFFGCSHMNNEQNYLWKKIITTFGSNNVEHQARI